MDAKRKLITDAAIANKSTSRKRLNHSVYYFDKFKKAHGYSLELLTHFGIISKGEFTIKGRKYLNQLKQAKLKL